MTTNSFSMRSSFTSTQICAVRRYSSSALIPKAKVPNGHWTNKKVQREFVKSIEEELGIKTWTDWYNVKVQDTYSLGLSVSYFFYSIIKRALFIITEVLCQSAYKFSLYQHSTYSKELFPEYPWKIWNFHSTGRNFWQDEKNHKLFLEDYAKSHNFKGYEDWYTVTNRDVCNFLKKFIS